MLPRQTTTPLVCFVHLHKTCASMGLYKVAGHLTADHDWYAWSLGKKNVLNSMGTTNSRTSIYVMCCLSKNFSVLFSMFLTIITFTSFVSKGFSYCILMTILNMCILHSSFCKNVPEIWISQLMYVPLRCHIQ